MSTYGLIGYPLGHSFSKRYFTEFFAQHGLDAEYKNFELPHIEQLANVLDTEPMLCGFNVTIPYKQQVFPFLDELDSAARTITCAAAAALCGAMVCGLADYFWNYPRVMVIFWFVFAMALAGTKVCRMEDEN